MNEKYLKLKIESVVNKILYEKNIIDKNVFEKTSTKLDKLMFEKNKKYIFLTFTLYLLF